jgi:hypothetical protein
MRPVVAVVLVVASLSATADAQSSDGRLKDLLQAARVEQANAFIEGDHDRFRTRTDRVDGDPCATIQGSGKGESVFEPVAE